MSKHKLIITLVVVAVSLGGWVTLRNADTPPPATDDAVAPAPGGAGFIATTGDPDEAAKELGSDAFSTSAEGLVEEPVDGGGYKVDLQGRFQHAATASLADSDSVTVECLPDTAAGGGR